MTSVGHPWDKLYYVGLYIATMSKIIIK